MATIELKNMADTIILGNSIANLVDADSPPAILMHGPLGCGKTALASCIVSALPKMEDYEFASPSFNICNFYSVYPPVMHCDFYNCKRHIPEDILEFFFDGKTFILAEWAEYLPELPNEYLDIFFKFDNNNRLLTLKAKGTNSKRLLNALNLMP